MTARPASLPPTLARVKTRRGILAVWLGLLAGGASLLAACAREEEQLDGRPVTYWVAELQNTDPARRGRAAEAFARSAPRSPQAVGALLSAFATERNPEVHVALAETLGALGKSARPATPGLVRLLQDSHPEVRARVMVTLARIGATEATPDLIARLRDPDHDVRAAAAEALGRLGEASAAPALAGALGDRISFVRLQAVEALGALRPPADVGVPALRRALRDPYDGVRRAACAALGAYGAAAAGDRDLVRELREVAAHDESSEVRTAASRALDAIGDPDVIRPRDPHPGTRRPPTGGSSRP